MTVELILQFIEEEIEYINNRMGVKYANQVYWDGRRTSLEHLRSFIQDGESE